MLWDRYKIFDWNYFMNDKNNVNALKPKFPIKKF